MLLWPYGRPPGLLGDAWSKTTSHSSANPGHQVWPVEGSRGQQAGPNAQGDIPLEATEHQAMSLDGGMQSWQGGVLEQPRGSQ